MKSWLLVAGVTPVLLAGCSYLTRQDAASCSIDPDERPAEVVTQSDLPKVSETESNLGVHVTSTLEDPVRVTVRVGRARAVDITVPGTPSDCSHEPVYRYAYRLPPGPMTVTATTNQGQRATTTVNLDAARRWVVVQVQEGFPLEVNRWDSEPQWG